MANPQKAAYRVCPTCSNPVPFSEGLCNNCGHSLSSQPVETESDNILRGRVFYSGRWIAISEKARAEKFMEEQLAKGLVEHNGQWVTIEEKLQIDTDLLAEENKLVEFPVKPIPSPSLHGPAGSEVKSPSVRLSVPSANWAKMKRRRRVIVAILAVISVMAMCISVFGIFLSKGGM